MEIEERMTSAEKRIKQTEESIQAIILGFPNGDLAGHCRAHQSLIENVEARKRLAQAIQEKTISGLIWAGIVGLGALFWQGILRTFHMSN